MWRNFSVRRHVKLTRVNKIEAMYERPRVNVKVERGSTFAFTFGLSVYYTVGSDDVKVLKSFHLSFKLYFSHTNSHITLGPPVRIQIAS